MTSNKIETKSDQLTKSEKLMEGIGEWASYYISRPDIFADEYLGLSLKPFQKILLYTMMNYNYNALFASRGLGKTFITAVFCVIICILKPGTKIIVASGQKSQAMKIVTEKIPELMNMSKNNNLKREIKGKLRTSMNSDDPNVEFHNGSWIKVVASTQGARSARANLLILDEFRMIDPKIYKNVLRRFLASSRQPGYLDKEPYKNNQEFLERNKEIFLTSCYFKFNWSYQRYKIFVKAMTSGKSYFVTGFPYQVAIKENLVNKFQLLDELAEDDIDEIGWEMEMNSMFFGESEKSYFKTQEIQDIKILENPLYKKETLQLLKGRKKSNPKKNPDELRILSCDIALLGGDKNDASVYTLITGKKNKSGKRYQREVLNIETHQGLHPETQALIIRRLFEDYDCDYIVLDRQGNGMSVYSYLCRKLYDNERKKEYMPFYSMNEKDDPKLSMYHTEDDFEERIFTISATEEFNSEIALDLKDKIVNKRINFLVSKTDARENFLNETWFEDLSIDDQVELLNPFIQSILLENEMVLLERIPHDKYVKLKEQSGKRKDRYVSLAYGNHFITLKEQELNVHDFDESDLEDLVIY